MWDPNIFSPYNIDIKQIMANPDVFRAFVAKMNKMPIPMHEIFMSQETEDFIDYLSGKYELNEEQTANISRIIRNILLGDLDMDDLAPTITLKLSIDLTPANNLAEEIKKTLFTPTINNNKISAADSNTINLRDQQP